MRALTIILLTGLLAPLAAADEELILKDGVWVKAPAPAEGTPAGELAIIRRDLDNGDYASAVKAAESFFRRYPSDPLREEAMSLAADALIRQGAYWQAYILLEDQLAQFPNGRLRERALDREMEVAQAFLAGAKKKIGKVLPVSAVEDGIEILERVAERSPGTDRAELALLAIAGHYFNKQQWDDAAAQYDAFIKLYPKSPRAVHARLRAAESFHRAYRGPDYDATPLAEAEQRYKAFAAAFPNEAREGRVADILDRIRAQRAAGQMVVAEYYARTGQPAAAAMYYQMVAEEFPDTPSGQLARARVGGAAPAEPPTPEQPVPAAPGTASPKAQGAEPAPKEGAQTKAALPGGAVAPPPGDASPTPTEGEKESK